METGLEVTDSGLGKGLQKRFIFQKMKPITLILFMMFVSLTGKNQPPVRNTRILSAEVLKVEISGGWAGKILGVIGEKRPEASTANLYLSKTIVFKTGDKKNENYKFSFQK